MEALLSRSPRPPGLRHAAGGPGQGCPAMSGDEADWPAAVGLYHSQYGRPAGQAAAPHCQRQHQLAAASYPGANSWCLLHRHPAHRFRLGQVGALLPHPPRHQRRLGRTSAPRAAAARPEGVVQQLRDPGGGCQQDAVVLRDETVSRSRQAGGRARRCRPGRPPRRSPPARRGPQLHLQADLETKPGAYHHAGFYSSLPGKRCCHGVPRWLIPPGDSRRGRWQAQLPRRYRLWDRPRLNINRRSHPHGCTSEVRLRRLHLVQQLQ